jgi:peptidyl-prolyl cis-trans isomerase B (cyclophilin B)
MAMQQFFQKPENKPYYDSLGKLFQTRNAEAYEAYIMSLKPIVEQQLGVSTEKNVSSELVKAYTTTGGAPHLDGQYTVFGKVIKGLEVIDKIAAQPVDQAHRPMDDVRMMISVEELSKKKIEKLYGYKYPEANKK